MCFLITRNLIQTLIPSCWFEIVFPTYFDIEVSYQNCQIVFK
jgi:hypothetical protein